MCMQRRNLTFLLAVVWAGTIKFTSDKVAAEWLYVHTLPRQFKSTYL